MGKSNTKAVCFGAVTHEFKFKCGVQVFSNGREGIKVRQRLHARTCGCNKDDVYGLKNEQTTTYEFEAGAEGGNKNIADKMTRANLLGGRV